MEVNIFGFRLVLDRAICPFCLSTDAIALTLDIYAVLNPFILPLAAVADGAALVGIYDEIRYQAEVVNMLNRNALSLLESIEIILIALLFFVFLLINIKAAIGFLAMSSGLFIINIFRYSELKSGSEREEDSQIKYYIMFELLLFALLLSVIF